MTINSDRRGYDFMMEEEATRNYLLDYRMCGDLGPMRIISINVVVNE